MLHCLQQLHTSQEVRQQRYQGRDARRESDEVMGKEIRREERKKKSEIKEKRRR